MSRDMAYIVTVDTINPIEGKDRIVYIGFKENGYHVIADKSFVIGEQVVYFEVDSILPEVSCFEFLRKRCYREELHGFLLKNMKMCGLYSNGLILHQKECGFSKIYNSGYDVSNILKIRKYEPDEDASPKKETNKIRIFIRRHRILSWLYSLLRGNKDKKSNFPALYINKSDETNIQNHKDWFDLYGDIPCYVTTKMEGQSVTMLFFPKKNKLGDFCVYSRNTYGASDLWNLAKNILAENKLRSAFVNTGHVFAVQGERCAPGVQKGIYKNGEHLYLYTVKDLTENRLLDYTEFISFCDSYGFEHVPVVFSGLSIKDIFKSLDEMQEYTEHQWFHVSDSVFTNYDDRHEEVSAPEYHRHEGLVIRGMNNEFSFKVKSNEYQLSF